MPQTDAFISYSHADCGHIAPIIQKGIENIGKPWYRLKRNLNVFRDETNLTASPGLWPAIETALVQSRYFILLASPIAASSKWVCAEVEAWIQQHHDEENGLKNIFIVLTDGTLEWNEKETNFNWSTTNCIPPVLQHQFKYEPNWIDLKPYVKLSQQNKSIDYKAAGFTTAMTKIIGAITGEEPRNIESDELKRIGHIRMFLFLGIATLVALILMTLYFFTAKQKLDQVSAANLLVAEGNAIAATYTREAFSYYVQAYTQNPDTNNYNIMNRYYLGHSLYDSLDISEIMPWDTTGVKKDTINGFYEVLKKAGADFSLTKEAGYTEGVNATTYHYMPEQQLFLAINQDTLRLFQQPYQKYNQSVVQRTRDSYFSDRYVNPVQTNQVNNTLYFKDINAAETMLVIKAMNAATGKVNPVFTVVEKRSKQQAIISKLYRIIDSAALIRDAFLVASEDGNQLALLFYFASQADPIKGYLINLKENSVQNISLRLPPDFASGSSLVEAKISPDNKLIAINFLNIPTGGSCLVYRLEDGVLMRKISNSEAWDLIHNYLTPNTIAWQVGKTEDNKLFCGTVDGFITAYDVDTTINSTETSFPLVCKPTSNCGTITSLCATENYIMAATEKGNVLTWYNSNIYNEGIEFTGYPFISQINTNGKPIQELYFNEKTALMYAVSKDGSLFKWNVKQLLSLSRDPAVLQQQIKNLIAN